MNRRSSYRLFALALVLAFAIIGATQAFSQTPSSAAMDVPAQPGPGPLADAVRDGKWPAQVAAHSGAATGPGRLGHLSFQQSASTPTAEVAIIPASLQPSHVIQGEDIAPSVMIVNHGAISQTISIDSTLAFTDSTSTTYSSHLAWPLVVQPGITATLQFQDISLPSSAGLGTYTPVLHLVGTEYDGTPFDLVTRASDNPLVLYEDLGDLAEVEDSLRPRIPAWHYHYPYWVGVSNTSVHTITLDARTRIEMMGPRHMPYAGEHVWWSGDDTFWADSRLSRDLDLTSATVPVTLTVWARYVMEAGWDYFFVEVSTDGGSSWSQLPDLDGVTTSEDPNGRLADYGGLSNGITGASHDWTQLRFSLSSYVGQQIVLRFRYCTDGGLNFDGICLDDISVDDAGGSLFSDGAENGQAGWNLESAAFPGGTPGVGWRVAGESVARYLSTLQEEMAVPPNDSRILKFEPTQLSVLPVGVYTPTIALFGVNSQGVGRYQLLHLTQKTDLCDVEVQQSLGVYGPHHFVNYGPEPFPLVMGDPLMACCAQGQVASWPMQCEVAIEYTTMPVEWITFQEESHERGSGWIWPGWDGQFWNHYFRPRPALSPSPPYGLNHVYVVALKFSTLALPSDYAPSGQVVIGQSITQRQYVVMLDRVDVKITSINVSNEWVIPGDQFTTEVNIGDAYPGNNHWGQPWGHLNPVVDPAPSRTYLVFKTDGVDVSSHFTSTLVSSSDTRLVYEVGTDPGATFDEVSIEAVVFATEVAHVISGTIPISGATYSSQQPEPVVGRVTMGPVPLSVVPGSLSPSAVQAGQQDVDFSLTLSNSAPFSLTLGPASEFVIEDGYTQFKSALGQWATVPSEGTHVTTFHGDYVPHTLLSGTFSPTLVVIGTRGNNGEPFRPRLYLDDNPVSVEGGISPGWTLDDWTDDEPLNDPRWNMDVVAAGGYLFALGGSSSPSKDLQIEKTTVEPDGTLGPWAVLTATLPDTFQGHMAAASAGHLYVGDNFGWCAPIQSGGVIGPWSSLGCSGSRRQGERIAYRGGVYMMGGSSTGGGAARAEIQPDGSLGSWKFVSSMIAPRSDFASVIATGWLYAIGGYDANVALSSIERARIHDDGSLGPWVPCLDLPAPRMGLGAVAVGGHIYVMGGCVSEADCSAETYVATLGPDGAILSWDNGPSLQRPRARFGGSVAGQYVHVVGGAEDLTGEQILTSMESVGIATGTVPTPTTGTIPLDQGWNLISLPLEPDDPAPDAVLSSVAGQYDQVHAYHGCDAADPWKRYEPGGGDNDLAAMDVRYGYWIHATASVTLTITGTQPTATDIPLCLGWNLIGWPSSQAITLPDALSSIADDYDLVYGYDPTDAADPWKGYDPTAPAFANDLAKLEPGKGYWVQASTVCTLTVTQ